jgi:hypothetical protein
MKNVQAHFRMVFPVADAVIKSPQDPAVPIAVLGETMEKDFFESKFNAQHYVAMSAQQIMRAFRDIMAANGKKTLYLLHCKAILEPDRNNYV